MVDKFIGRRDELQGLNRLFSRRSASLVVVRGRRRIGKSRLIEEFGKNNRFLKFSGIAPTEEMTDQAQRDAFVHQLFSQLELPLPPGGWTTSYWADVFTLLAKHTKEGRVVILFDEISWMGSLDPYFLGHLKNAWDLQFKQNPQLILIFCGSVSTWIEENIINSTAFFGRISYYVNLEELTLPECNEFLDAKGFRRSDYEKLKYLSITGGVPWYLELIDPKLSADDNIKNLCFRSDGVLVPEFKMIFHDLFSKQSELFKRIVTTLSDGAHTFNELCQALSYKKGGVVTKYLNHLITAGFIRRDYTWIPKTGKVSSLSHYRLKDNFLRFYLKYMEPRLPQIEANAFKDMSISSLSGWDTMMGFQFENLVLQNRELIWNFLHCRPEDIVYTDPYFQTKTATRKGCQIDFMIQTRQKFMFAVEIKFSRNELKKEIVQEMKEKLDRLVLPRGFACSPVLIHANGVENALRDADYFGSIIDFSAMLHGG